METLRAEMQPLNNPVNTIKSKSDLKEEEPKKLNLTQLVDSISEEMSAGKNMERIRYFMENYEPSAGELQKYALFDSKCNYTRNLIATDQENYTLMLLCWNPAKGSPMHDHAGSQCFLRMIEGEVVEIRAAYPTEEDVKNDKPLTIMKRAVAKAPDVVFINDSLGLHKIENVSDNKRAISLHCYIPPYNSCKCFVDYEKSSKGCEVNIRYYSENGKTSVLCTKP